MAEPQTTMNLAIKYGNYRFAQGQARERGEHEQADSYADSADATLRELQAHVSGVRVDAPQCEWPSCGCVDAYCKAWPKDEDAAGVLAPSPAVPDEPNNKGGSK
jgi:RES domain-containing protein